MRREFGRLLRKARKDANKTMLDLAKLLDVSVSYVSDVEHGRRLPWSNDRIRQLAQHLHADPVALIGAAGLSKGGLELEVNGTSPRRTEIGAALARRWPEISDQELDDIERALGKGTKR